MSDKEEARKSRAEEHKKLIEHLNSYDSGPRDHDAEKAERERLLFLLDFDPDDPRHGG